MTYTSILAIITSSGVSPSFVLGFMCYISFWPLALFLLYTSRFKRFHRRLCSIKKNGMVAWKIFGGKSSTWREVWFAEFFDKNRSRKGGIKGHFRKKITTDCTAPKIEHWIFWLSPQIHNLILGMLRFWTPWPSAVVQNWPPRNEVFSEREKPPIGKKLENNSLLFFLTLPLFPNFLNDHFIFNLQVFVLCY